MRRACGRGVRGFGSLSTRLVLTSRSRERRRSGCAKVTDLRYGPATGQVRAALDRCREDPAAVWGRVRPWSDWYRSDAAYRMLKRPRDYAWDRFHDGIRAHDLTEAFELLW